MKQATLSLDPGLFASLNDCFDDFVLLMHTGQLHDQELSRTSPSHAFLSFRISDPTVITAFCSSIWWDEKLSQARIE